VYLIGSLDGGSLPTASGGESAEGFTIPNYTVDYTGLSGGNGSFTVDINNNPFEAQILTVDGVASVAVDDKVYYKKGALEQRVFNLAPENTSVSSDPGPIGLSSPMYKFINFIDREYKKAKEESEQVLGEVREFFAKAKQLYSSTSAAYKWGRNRIITEAVNEVTQAAVEADSFIEMNQILGIFKAKIQNALPDEELMTWLTDGGSVCGKISIFYTAETELFQIIATKSDSGRVSESDIPVDIVFQGLREGQEIPRKYTWINGKANMFPKPKAGKVTKSGGSIYHKPIRVAKSEQFIEAEETTDTDLPAEAGVQTPQSGYKWNEARTRVYQKTINHPLGPLKIDTVEVVYDKIDPTISEGSNGYTIKHNIAGGTMPLEIGGVGSISVPYSGYRVDAQPSETLLIPNLSPSAIGSQVRLLAPLDGSRGSKAKQNFRIVSITTKIGVNTYNGLLAGRPIPLGQTAEIQYNLRLEEVEEEQQKEPPIGGPRDRGGGSTGNTDDVV